MTLKDIVGKYSGNVITGTDKGNAHSYIEFYDLLLGSYVGKGVTLLELGVASGKSLLMWEEFLVNGKIFGIDISGCPKCLEGHPLVTFRRADLSKRESISNAFPGQTFDIIIDDASHQPEYQALAAALLLPRLNPGGTYVIEDVSCGQERFNGLGISWRIDLRHIKNRPDDVMVVFRK